MNTATPNTGGWFASLRRIGESLSALLRSRIELFTVEWQEEKLRLLPRMGGKLEEKVLRSIAQYRQRAGRFLLSFADQVAEKLTAQISGPGIEKITPAGSLRRGKETVGDLDMLISGPAATDAMEVFVKLPEIHEVLVKGGNKASAKVGLEGLQVDVREGRSELYVELPPLDLAGQLLLRPGRRPGLYRIFGLEVRVPPITNMAPASAAPAEPAPLD